MILLRQSIRFHPLVQEYIRQSTVPTRQSADTSAQTSPGVAPRVAAGRPLSRVPRVAFWMMGHAAQGDEQSGSRATPASRRLPHLKGVR